MPIHIAITLLCDTCGGPVTDVSITGPEFSTEKVTDFSDKVVKKIRKWEKKTKSKIAVTSGRVTCKTCRPTANKSPKWSKG